MEIIKCEYRRNRHPFSINPLINSLSKFYFEIIQWKVCHEYLWSMHVLNIFLPGFNQKEIHQHDKLMSYNTITA